MPKKASEKMGFQTEVNQLLHLVTHSLYSNKEIFLRELISNSSDAIDKLKFLALSDNALYAGDADLKIQISYDEDKNTLTISDNGIGMSREELIENLGTIAKSGTKAFFNNLTGEESKDSALIGQFGVGFYSAFIVADKVEVNSRKAGEDKAYCWTSDGKSDFEISNSKQKQRGTSITLHLKESEKDYTNAWTLSQIVNKYADHISSPVLLWTAPIAEEKDDKGEVIVAATEGKFEQINKAKALWTRSKSDISDEEYQTFYQHISHDYQDALAWSHNKVEGKLEYTSLLYIPKKSPWDMFNRDVKHGLKLFVQRVFIMDDAEQFLPNYLRFVKGVIDANDLPLNVSRELLQDNQITQSLKKACTKRVISLLTDLAKDNAKYKEFWQEFSSILKEGVAEDFANKAEIAKLLRFASTHDSSLEPTVALEDYISRMKDGQDKIYYVVADSKNAAKQSPHLEIFNKNGIEVLLLWERIDEWMMSYLTEFEGKSFEAVNKTDISGKLFDQQADKPEQPAEEKAKVETLLTKVKEILGDKVIDVRISKRLTKTPSCVVLEGHAMSSQMAKLMQAAGQNVPAQKYIFELNMEHPILAIMSKLLADESSKDATNDATDSVNLANWTQVLFDQAVLAEQGNLDDSAAFIEKVNQLLLAK